MTLLLTQIFIQLTLDINPVCTLQRAEKMVWNCIMSTELTYFNKTTSNHSNNITDAIKNQPGMWYDGAPNCVIQFQERKIKQGKT